MMTYFLNAELDAGSEQQEIPALNNRPENQKQEAGPLAADERAASGCRERCSHLLEEAASPSTEVLARCSLSPPVK
jgi:hypothetical protein